MSAARTELPGPDPLRIIPSALTSARVPVTDVPSIVRIRIRSPGCGGDCAEPESGSVARAVRAVRTRVSCRMRPPFSWVTAPHAQGVSGGEGASYVRLRRWQGVTTQAGRGHPTL